MRFGIHVHDTSLACLPRIDCPKIDCKSTLMHWTANTRHFQEKVMDYLHALGGPVVELKNTQQGLRR